MNSRKDKVNDMPTTAIRSSTKVYCTYKKKFEHKWVLVEITGNNGIRKYKLTHFSDRTQKYRTIDLNTKVMKARLRFMRDNRADELMKQIDDGTLYLKLLRLDRDVEYAVDKQVMKWQETDTEYIAAENDFLKQFAISQNLRAIAEQQIYNAMVYV